jgi:hypothetical protein
LRRLSSEKVPTVGELSYMTNEQLLSEWLTFGRSFSGPTGAILAHGRDCRFYVLISRGGRPQDADCTCKAATASKRLLWLVQETKARVDEADERGTKGKKP